MEGGVWDSSPSGDSYYIATIGFSFQKNVKRLHRISLGVYMNLKKMFKMTISLNQYNVG